jgi:hypothetical protein
MQLYNACDTFHDGEVDKDIYYINQNGVTVSLANIGSLYTIICLMHMLHFRLLSTTVNSINYYQVYHRQDFERTLLRVTPRGD